MPVQYTKRVSSEQVEGFAAVGMTDDEIARITKIAKSAWPRKWEKLIDHGRARLRKTVRVAQLKAGLRGNGPMLVWLGKQYLEQRDGDSAGHATANTLIVSPDVLTRLQHSYRQTMGNVQSVIESRVGAGGGPLGDRHPILKRDPLAQNSGESGIAVGDGGVCIDESVPVPKVGRRRVSRAERYRRMERKGKR